MKIIFSVLTAAMLLTIVAPNVMARPKIKIGQLNEQICVGLDGAMSVPDERIVDCPGTTTGL